MLAVAVAHWTAPAVQMELPGGVLTWCMRAALSIAAAQRAVVAVRAEVAEGVRRSSADGVAGYAADCCLLKANGNSSCVVCSQVLRGLASPAAAASRWCAHLSSFPDSVGFLAAVARFADGTAEYVVAVGGLGLAVEAGVAEQLRH
jgi:hypothetical protein